MKHLKQLEEYKVLDKNDEKYILDRGDKVFYQEYSWREIDKNSPVYKIIERDGLPPNINSYEIERLFEPNLWKKLWVKRHQLIFISEIEYQANKYNL